MPILAFLHFERKVFTHFKALNQKLPTFIFKTNL